MSCLPPEPPTSTDVAGLDLLPGRPRGLFQVRKVVCEPAFTATAFTFPFLIIFSVMAHFRGAGSLEE